MQTSNKNSFKTFYKDLRKLFNKKSILWGGSGKGVMLLNILNIQKDKMKYIIDINPQKMVGLCSSNRSENFTP